jgi:glycosyltransferase involved in cell wall biosynthesis
VIPLISVLVPVRNGAATVGAAVTSTLAALPENAEVLVCDDRSTDATRQVLAAVRDPRLVVLRSDTGTGVAHGLNTALEAASGTWVARIDADDVTLPGRFARQLRAARRGADLVFSGHVRFGRSIGAFKQKRPWALDADTVRVWLALENPLTHPTMFGRAATVRAVGGYRPGPAEDYDLWLRLSTAGARVVRQLTPGIAYRMHPGQVTMGAAYLASLLRDDHLRTAHDAHAASLGWSGGSVWPVLWVPATTEEERARKAAYWDFLIERSHELDAFQGLLLRQALARGFAGSTAPGWTA